MEDQPILDVEAAPEAPRQSGRAKYARAIAAFGLVATLVVFRTTYLSSSLDGTYELSVNGHGNYKCKNGYPDVPHAYLVGAWGNLCVAPASGFGSGDWVRSIDRSISRLTRAFS